MSKITSNDPNKVQVDWTTVDSNKITTINKEVSIYQEDIYYIVRLKERYKNELYHTTITTDFCGKIINQTAGNIYFELNGSNAFVIVPHSWIEFLAPSKKLWKEEKRNEN